MVRSAYDNQIKELEMQRDQARVQRQQEIDYLRERELILNEEVRRNAAEKKEMVGKILASNYDAMLKSKQAKVDQVRQMEKNIDSAMLEGAKHSLQIDEVLRDEKAKVLAKYVASGMSEQEARREMMRVQSDMDRQEYLAQVAANSKEQLAKEANYRNFYKQTAERQAALQRLHEQNVLQLAKSKERNIEDIIDKNVADYQRRLAENEMKRVQQRQDVSLLLWENHRPSRKTTKWPMFFRHR